MISKLLCYMEKKGDTEQCISCVPVGGVENLYLSGHRRKNTFGWMYKSEVASGGEGRGRCKMKNHIH